MEKTQTVDERTLLRRVMMMRKGLKQRALAEQWNTSQSFVSQLISGKCRSELHERKFAEIVGLPREQLFETSKGNSKNAAHHEEPVEREPRDNTLPFAGPNGPSGSWVPTGTDRP